MLAPHPYLPLIACGSWDAMIWMLDFEGRIVDEVSTDVKTEIYPVGRFRSMKVPFTSRWNPDGTVLATAWRGGEVGLFNIKQLGLPLISRSTPNNITLDRQAQKQHIQAANRFLGALVRQNPHIGWTKLGLQALHTSICVGQRLVLSKETVYTSLKQLPSELELLTHLRELSLSGTQLERLPAEIAQLQQLYVLDLQELNLEAWPNALCELKQLRYLYLRRSNIQELPACIGQLTALRSLNLNGTPLQHLPPEIGQLPNLQQLSLLGTRIRSLPAEMAQLDQLKSLELPTGVTRPAELAALFKRLVRFR